MTAAAAPAITGHRDDRTTDRTPRGRAGRLLIALVVLVSAAGFAATASVGVALAPVVVVAAGYALWTLPLRYTVFTFFLLAVSVDTLPASTKLGWRAPFSGFGGLLLDNLNKATGISALRFAASEVLLVLIVVVAVARTFAGYRVDRAERLPGASPLHAVAALSLAAVIALELWGIARGGDVRQSLWQFRQLLWLPVYVWVFSYSLRGPGDVRTVAYLLTAAACFKLAIGAYFLVFVAWPAGLEPPTMVGHADTVIFVTVAMIWLTAWIHAPARRRFVPALIVCSLMMTALALNNRRIAFVSLIGGIVLLFVILRGPIKRRMLRAIVLSLPLIALYLAVGRNRSGGIFKPASLVMSVVAGEDGSSKTRDIENYNLIQTLKPRKLLGSGWGHQYNELQVAYDISHDFEQYRFIPHNSVLWLFTVGGIVGFTLLWLPIGVGVFLARRGYYFARDSYERTVAAVSLSVFLTYIIQAWGDMGTQGMSCALILAWALAASGKLAAANGAWPAGVRLIASRQVVPRGAAAPARGRRPW